MQPTAAGHQGPMPLRDVIRLIERTSYKQWHVAWNRVGVQKGLPPDVATVQMGTYEDATWWNLKKGYIPEQDVRTQGGVVNDEEVLELMHKHGMHPLAHAMSRGISRHPGAMSLFSAKGFQRRVPSKLLYIGWRRVLISMFVNHALRPSRELERMLGRREYEIAYRKRRCNETVHYDENFGE